MSRAVELPIVEPLFRTYQTYGSSGAIIQDNPSVNNWFYNRASVLSCERNFLAGRTTPGIYVNWVNIFLNPHLERYEIPMKPLGEYIHEVIRGFLEEGFYIHYFDIDDYYLEGKSWYGERHFPHDGLICGYDDDAKTYSIYAYDKDWICRVIKIPISCFEEGRRASFEAGNFGHMYALKVKKEPVKLNYKEMCDNLKIHINSSLEQCPPDLELLPLKQKSIVAGLAVHDYICIYLDMIVDGCIPHERMDRRVFRLIWEHKNVMHKRFQVVEDDLGFDHELSERYESVLKKADNGRFLYASYQIKRRDVLVPTIQKILRSISEEEKPLIEAFIEKIKSAALQ